MIGIFKSEEPADHSQKRNSHLSRLRLIPRKTSKDIYGYDSQKSLLWKLQHGKCCYCEQKIPYPYNDVEHYRPKAEALREPGSIETYGYWWLAYSWENLFYSCASCNRSSKNSLFPLAIGSMTLHEEEPPPGNEIPLLSYPGNNDAAQHIGFELVSRAPYDNLSWWRAVPINNSEIGRTTIETIGLNEQDRVEVRMNYFRDTLNPLVRRIKIAASKNDIVSKNTLLASFFELFFANQPFSVFSFSVFEATFEDGCRELSEIGIDFNRSMLGCIMDINYSRIA